ncbi:hypothetical protein DRO61_07730 [Candidatus Bathyarchaeota archaeon]|nr:MAG: hypothetical protein DRO61_07730 [Candidatus Bathyarchaeota archaeon]
MKNITSNCSTQQIGGIETTVYIFNRTDIDTITYSGDSLVTDLTLTSGTTAFTIMGVKKSLNAGSTRVVAEDMADRFTHTFDFKGFEFDSASVENLDAIKDVVCVVERKAKNVDDGTFVIYGLGTGLYVATDEQTSNEANGTRALSLATMPGWEEKNSQNNLLDTDYATTKALLEGLL